MADDLISMLSDLAVVAQAKERYEATDAYQSGLQRRFEDLHFYYAPPDDDQWPEDRLLRPDHIHLSVNVCRPAVNIDARLQAKQPRIALDPDSVADKDRLRAQSAEKLYQIYLALSEWDIWLGDLCKVKSLYGQAYLKPFWNKAENRPDVRVIETPGNLRIGWGASDYSAVDWAIYEYSISPLQCKMQYPNLVVDSTTMGRVTVLPRRGAGSKSDPLNQTGVAPYGRPQRENSQYADVSDYEKNQLRVWDYWYRDEEDVVRNAIIVEGVLAKDISKHPELLDIPYIPIENVHEPGSPIGISTIEGIIGPNLELNRAYSHLCQLINDEVDPSWQFVAAEDGQSLPDGVVPRAGEIAALNGGRIDPITKSVNIFPIKELVDELWTATHKISGLPEILWTMPPGAQTAGRALALQVEAAINQLEPKRDRLYQGLKRLLLFWAYMLEKVNPKVPVPNEQGEIEMRGVRDVVVDLHRFRVVAPELTPRDVIESTQNELNKVQGKLSSLRSAMDRLGTDNPEEELQLIEKEHSNIRLYPGDVQTFAAVIATVFQLMQQQPQLAGQLGGMIPTANDTAGQGKAMLDAQQAQPTLLNDQNMPQPMSQPGSAPPPGAPAPLQGGAPAGAVTGTALTRTQPGGQAITLNQLSQQFRAV